MNQAILCVLGLTAIVVMCSSEPLEKRRHNREEMSGRTEEDGRYPASKANSTLKVCFKECRKIKRSGLTAACNEDEIAVGCETTGFSGCGASQAYSGQGCMVNKCRDIDYTPWADGIIKAVCCKRNAVQAV